MDANTEALVAAQLTAALITARPSMLEGDVVEAFYRTLKAVQQQKPKTAGFLDVGD
ncbi:hypothetical protein [Xylophilus sp.]|uniref:hypothetical protein n=1 Tax=Xylophilus sp. TaxID=2653893 RepID=UPI0013BB826E|nr:hypothetical protein [Xylophilus sp.]KAF1045628.1 MAG: hypothetical protein GAK38_02920 [Xylophilus sp.]